MSQADLDVVRGVFRDTNARDFAAVMAAYAEDVRLALHGHFSSVSGGEVVSGKTAVGEWFGDWFRQFGSDYRFDIEEIEAAGGRVFLVAAHLGHGRASGVPVEQRTAYVYLVEAGLIHAIDVWPETERALARRQFESD